MRRTPFAVLTAFLLTLFVAVVPAVPAQAQGDERITAYNVNATLDRDGDARVTLDLTYDFADADRHGPYLTFVTRQSLTDNPGHVRHVTYSDIHASSPSGAPANLHEENGGALQLRIGSKDRTVTGTQKYRITYMVHGLIGRDNKESHLDEINWRIFTNVDVPVDNSKVTITAPANVTRVYCEVEDGECDTSSTGTKTVTFSARKIDANTTWRVVAGVPAGTFTSAADATVTEESEVTSGSRADLPQYLTVIPYIVAVVALGLIGLGASLCSASATWSLPTKPLGSFRHLICSRSGVDAERSRGPSSSIRRLASPRHKQEPSSTAMPTPIPSPPACSTLSLGTICQLTRKSLPAWCSRSPSGGSTGCAGRTRWRLGKLVSSVPSSAAATASPPENCVARMATLRCRMPRRTSTSSTTRPATSRSPIARHGSGSSPSGSP